MKINKIFKDLYTSTKRYFLITGGRNSGKSFAVSDYILRLTYQKNQNILYTRYTLVSAALSIIPEFIEKIELNKVENHFEVTKTEIINKLTGSRIIFRGIKTSSGVQTANLKSLQGITTWVIDEAEELTDVDIFEKIDLSIRSNILQNRIILILNPTDKTHWIWKKWFENSNKLVNIDNSTVQISTHVDLCHIHSTYLNNLKNIPIDYLKQIFEIKNNNLEKYRRIILGEWQDYSDAILFINNNLKRFNLNNFDLSLNNQIIGAIDTKLTGEDYYCFILAKVENNKIYIIDVIFTSLNYKIAQNLSFGLIDKYKPSSIVIETNASGIIFLNEYRQAFPSTSIIGVNNYSKKESRILFQSQFIIDNFYFRNDFEPGGHYDLFLKNLCSYKENGDNDHDDAADCTAILAAYSRKFIV